jgi:hypothetical protein
VAVKKVEDLTGFPEMLDGEGPCRRRPVTSLYVQLHVQ